MSNNSSSVPKNLSTSDLQLLQQTQTYSSNLSSLPTLERLQAVLKQKEGEIANLQIQNSSLEKTRGNK